MKTLPKNILIFISLLFTVSIWSTSFANESTPELASDGANQYSEDMQDDTGPLLEGDNRDAEDDVALDEELKEQLEIGLSSNMSLQSWGDGDESGLLNDTINAIYTHPRSYEPSKVQAFSANVLGDSISPLDGQLSFSQTDVSLPGNSHLPVEFTRKLSGFFSASAAEFGLWRLNLPSLETMVYKTKSNSPLSNVRVEGSAANWHNNRCDRLVLPSFKVYAQHGDAGYQRLFASRDGSKYFGGVTLNAPGAWGEKLMPLLGDSEMSADTKANVFGPSVPAYTTKSNWKFECLSSLKRGAGQGFKGIAPNGDIYYFDTLIYRITKSGATEFHQTYLDAGTITRGMLAASRVEDVHGNWVKYHYDGNGYIERIEANDGRRIDVSITRKSKSPLGLQPDLIDSATVTAAGKTWKYTFGDHGYLEVEIPSEANDQRKWVYDVQLSQGLSPYIYDETQSNDDYISAKICDYESYWNTVNRPAYGGINNAARPYLAKVTHPSGVVGEFILRNPNTTELNGQRVSNPVLRVTKSGVSHKKTDSGEFPCAGVSVNTLASHTSHDERHIIDNSVFSYNTADYTLPIAEKRLYGPGIDELVWRYGYEQGENLLNGLKLKDSPDLPATIQRTILDPEGNLAVLDVMRSNDALYGRVSQTGYYVDHERLPNAEGEQGNGMFLGYVKQKQVKTTFEKSKPIGMPWETQYSAGSLTNYKPNVELTDRHALPVLTETTLYLDGGANVYLMKRTYNEDLSSANYSYGSVTKLESWSNIGGYNGSATRERNIEYMHLKTKWVLNLEKSLSMGSAAQQTVVRSHSYHSNSSLVNQTWQFGKLVESNTYHSNGQLKRQNFNVSPSRWVEYSDYHRGVARQVEVATGDHAYTEVNDLGQTTKSVDFEGHCVEYRYDNAMRLKLVDPCFISGQGNSSNQHSEWASTHISYSQAANSELSGSNTAGMLKQSTQRGNYREVIYFDALQRPVHSKTWDTAEANDAVYSYARFDSSNRAIFKARPSSSPDSSNGFTTVFDSIGRTKRIDDNQTSMIDTQYFYETNNRVRMRNPRGYDTTTTYLGYTPSQSQPARIDSPEGISTVFSNFTHLLQPQSITQGGVVETRRYSGADLCKTSRPDVGNRWYGYNNLGELTWALLGSSWSAGCTSSKPNNSRTVSYTYDNRGNVKTVNYQDGFTPNKTFSYNKNGQATKLIFGDVTHQLDYIDDLVERETTIIGSRSFALTYKYDGLKQAKRLTYPSGKTIDPSYNALGQAKSAGSYATSARYHVNGVLKSHRYGNDAAFSQTLNNRLIPENYIDRRGNAYYINQTLSYDASNNLRSLTDRIDSAHNLALDYDGIDRLDTISDSFSGSGAVEYDSVGNIQSKRLGSETINYSYNNNQLTRTTGSYTRTFGYDEVGNVKSNGVHDFTYNLEGHMVQARLGDTINRYTYDGNGKRVRTVDTHGTSYSVYGQNGKLMYRYIENEGKHIDYIYLGGKLVARLDDQSEPTLGCPSGFTYLASTNRCVQTVNKVPTCPSGQTLSNGQCYGRLSGLQCQTHSAAVRSCQATNNTFVLTETDDYNDTIIWDYKWAGQDVAHDHYPPFSSNGFVYWTDDRSHSTLRSYSVVYGEGEDDEEYYSYDYYYACRCDQNQSVREGSPSLVCPAGTTASGNSCQRSQAPISVPGAGIEVKYVHSDYLGSPAAETNDSGAIVSSRMYYKPFGQNIGEERDEVGYTGHKFDTDLGLSYMQARYYDPAIGRFLSNDPVGFLEQIQRGNSPAHGFNRYAYANNNPYKYNDPTGEVPVIIVARIAVAACSANAQCRKAAADAATFVVEQALDIWLEPNSEGPAGGGGKKRRRNKKVIDDTWKENTKKNNGTNRCEDCGTEVKRQNGPNKKDEKISKSRGEVDHNKRLADGGADDTSNTSLKCNPCHKEKTREENRN